MKSIAWIFSLALIAGGIWYFTSWTQTATQQHIHQTIHTKNQPSAVQKSHHATSLPITSTPKKQQPKQNKQTEPSTTTQVVQSVVMHLADENVIAQSIHPRKLVPHVAALEIDQIRLKSLQKGDIFEIADLEGEDYHIKITDITQQGESKIASGSFKDEGISYPILITTGASGSTFIHLDTPSKTYEIELEDGKGYAYDSMEIRRTLSDESKDDFIVVEPKKNPKEQNPIME